MIADQLAKYAHELSYSCLPQKTVHEAKRRVLDSVGCALGAKKSLPAIITQKIAERVRIPEVKALHYGTQIRYLDYNDSYLSKEPAHPSDNIGPLLAVGEATRATGKDVILATVLAYEVQCRLCDAASLRKNGWDHVIYGLASSGLACGKLLGLSQEQLVQTLNLAMTTYVSTRQVREGTELSMWKASAFANAARNAIFSATLAKQGMKGPSQVFEGKYGVMNQLTGRFVLNTKNFGKNFKILDCWIKKWPAEIHSQSAIQAALNLRKNFNTNDVKTVVVETHEAGKTIIGTGKEKWSPKTRETADHSLPYVVAAALLHGKITRETFVPARINDPKIKALLNKVFVKENKKLTKQYPKTAANIVKVKLKTGKTFEARVDYHKGHNKNPLTDKEIEQKFRALSKETLSTKEQDKIIRFVWGLDKQKNLEPLTTLLR